MRENKLSNLASKHAKNMKTGRKLDKEGVVLAMLEHANPQMMANNKTPNQVFCHPDFMTQDAFCPP